MRSTTFPLRFVTIVAIGSCIFNAIYAVAVVLIHLFKADVAPGWATLSMQLSLMFFIVSLLLAFAVLVRYLVRSRVNCAWVRDWVTKASGASPNAPTPTPAGQAATWDDVIKGPKRITFWGEIWTNVKLYGVRLKILVARYVSTAEARDCYKRVSHHILFDLACVPFSFYQLPNHQQLADHTGVAVPGEVVCIAPRAVVLEPHVPLRRCIAWTASRPLSRSPLSPPSPL
jgi:hypothetical protein